MSSLVSEIIRMSMHSFLDTVTEHVSEHVIFNMNSATVRLCLINVAVYNIKLGNLHKNSTSNHFTKVQC